MATLGLAVGLAALTAACGGRRSATAEPAPRPYSATGADTGTSGRSAVAIEIDNRNYSDMTIYLIDGGVRVRVGSAPGLSKTSLSLPRGWHAAGGRVRLLADPVGSSAAIRTPTLIVGSGQSVYWTIGLDAASSYASAG
jgi:hypothetical protein